MKTALVPEHAIKEPKGLSKRVLWLRDYYFRGNDRAWNNEYTSWTTGTPLGHHL
jgi:formate C-acetyltransferase